MEAELRLVKGIQGFQQDLLGPAEIRKLIDKKQIPGHEHDPDQISLELGKVRIAAVVDCAPLLSLGCITQAAKAKYTIRFLQ
jgi:hypothetical protein